MDLLDQLGRPLRDLRISVTDRCNFRCTYCMPKEVFGPSFPFLHRNDLLTFEEIARLARIFGGCGARKIRITGGEPLLRRDLHLLVEMLAEVVDVDFSLTTNGVLLSDQASALKRAGLRRVTISLDSLTPAVFKAMTDVDADVEDVLKGIAAAEKVDLLPIKINVVVRRGVNDGTFVDLARYFRGTGHVVRFIEYMDVGTTNGWRLDEVVPSRLIVEAIHAEFPIEPIDPNYGGEVANRWRYRDGQGEIGVISSVTEPFCRTCTRLRLSPEGKLYTCLFASSGTDLRPLLRSDVDDHAIVQVITNTWHHRTDQYSEIRTNQVSPQQKIEMSYIGG